MEIFANYYDMKVIGTMNCEGSLLLLEIIIAKSRLTVKGIVFIVRGLSEIECMLEMTT